jgi:hypothetical protein
VLVYMEYDHLRGEMKEEPIRIVVSREVIISRTVIRVVHTPLPCERRFELPPSSERRDWSHRFDML